MVPHSSYTGTLVSARNQEPGAHPSLLLAIGYCDSGEVSKMQRTVFAMRTYP